MSEAVQGRGRPLRFLALVVIGWVGLRIAVLWPQTGSLPAAIRAVVPLPSFGPRGEEAPVTPVIAVTHQPPATPFVAVPPARILHAFLPRSAADPVRVRLATLGLFQFGAAEYTDSPEAPFSPSTPPPQTHFVPTTSRWSASGWLTVRQGSGLGAAPGGQLGGSQAGFRVAYLLDPRRRVAVFGRVVTPLSGPGREASIGVEWQPTRAPVRFVAEQRFGNGPGGQGVGIVAGVDSDIPGGFRLESYGQAGAIRRDRVEPYADGAVRATRPIGGTNVALGGGAWGAAQRDAQRFDIGPSATVSLPVGSQRVRIALDWRQRVAGEARPGSGLAVTLGSDF